MTSPHYRYFIELQPHGGDGGSRHLEAEARRTEARDFVAAMHGWIKEKKLDGNVSALGVTLFGQIQITCDTAVINLIRNQDRIDIAAIRQGTIYAENTGRWNESR